MNNQDYEQKKKKCWLQFCQENGVNQELNISIFDAFNYIFDRAFALGKQEKNAEDDKTLKVNRQLFCRLCADADDYINEYLEEDDSDYGYYQGRSDALHELYRGECKDAEDTVIQGWVAIDDDGDIFLYRTKPARDEVSGMWMSDECPLDVGINLFPDLTWESDPEPVEIIIKRKNNG
jgi:hypothetical protein